MLQIGCSGKLGERGEKVITAITLAVVAVNIPTPHTNNPCKISVAYVFSEYFVREGVEVEKIKSAIIITH